MAFGRKKTVTSEVGLDGGENAIANKEVEGLSQRQIVLRRFVRHRAAMISLFILISVIVFVFTAGEFHVGPLGWNGWWHYTIKDTPDLLRCKNGNVGCPTLTITPGKGWGLGKHPFGQDDIGHDYFALVMRGAQRSLLVTFIIGAIAGTIGTVVGSLAGFYRGTVDNVLMRFVDFLITIPSIIIGSVIGYHFGNLGATFLALYLGLFTWTGLSRLVRGEFLTLRERDLLMQPEWQVHLIAESSLNIFFRMRLASLLFQ